MSWKSTPISVGTGEVYSRQPSQLYKVLPTLLDVLYRLFHFSWRQPQSPHHLRRDTALRETIQDNHLYLRILLKTYSPQMLMKLAAVLLLFNSQFYRLRLLCLQLYSNRSVLFKAQWRQIFVKLVLQQCHKRFCRLLLLFQPTCSILSVITHIPRAHSHNLPFLPCSRIRSDFQ